jgi:hypothetical protein
MPRSDAPPHTRPAAATAAAWLTLPILLLCSIAAPRNQFKVPPIMTLRMEALGLSVSGAGQRALSRQRRSVCPTS